MEFILILAIVFLLAKFLGELCERIKLPSLLGEVATGIILGPYLLNLVSPTDQIFKQLAEIGVILLLFVAGFEYVNVKEMLKNKRISISISILSSLFPLLAVVWLLSYLGYPLMTSLFLGVALSATSMSASIRSMLSVGKLDSKAGRTVMGSLVINDVTGLIILAIIVGISTVGFGGSLMMEIGKIALGIIAFFILFVIAEKVLPWLMKYTVRLKVEEAQFTLAFVVVLLASFLAHRFGLSTIIGAFFAGIALSKSSLLETAAFSERLSSVSYGVFIPIFFVFTGSMIVLDNLFTVGKLALMFLFVITVVQITFAFVAAKFFKYSNEDSFIVGLGMLPYGEVTLVVMAILTSLAASNVERFGSLEGIQTLFSAVLILIALTLIITPVFMALVVRCSNYYKKKSKKKEKK